MARLPDGSLIGNCGDCMSTLSAKEPGHPRLGGGEVQGFDLWCLVPHSGWISRISWYHTKSTNVLVVPHKFHAAPHERVRSKRRTLKAGPGIRCSIFHYFLHRNSHDTTL